MAPGMAEDESGIEPQRIGRYRIVRPLSKGGMALVYEGRREALGGVAPRVAIKVILPDYAASSTFRELFINEARLGAAMHHQNLVQILDFDSDGERYFLVMEYVEGLTLSKVVGLAARHDVKVPMHVICEVGRQACEGLHYAHQAVDGKGRSLGLIHRDIKPSNLILNDQGGIKILDFGISKGRLRAERSGSVKGTWGYMAPEQANGARIGPNADVFGLGIVLYEMASRRSMFKGRKEEEIRQLLNDDYAHRLCGTLDPSYAPLATVLQRSLTKDPRQRYATAAEFGRHLAELLPDPVTVRQEMTSFYSTIRELYRAENPKEGKERSTGLDLADQVTRKPNFTLDPSRAADQRQTVMLSAMAGMLVVVLAFVLSFFAYRTFVLTSPPVVVDADPSGGLIASPLPELDPPDGAEGDGAATTEPTTEPEVVKTPPPDDGCDLSSLGANEGFVKLDVVQQARIYVDGDLLPPADHGRCTQALPAGRVLSVHWVAQDGRRVVDNLKVEAGTVVRKTWDFDAYDWQ